jgi:hypothetical protein
MIGFGSEKPSLALQHHHVSSRCDLTITVLGDELDAGVL